MPDLAIKGSRRGVTHHEVRHGCDVRDDIEDGHNGQASSSRCDGHRNGEEYVSHRKISLRPLLAVFSACVFIIAMCHVATVQFILPLPLIDDSYNTNELSTAVPDKDGMNMTHWCVLSPKMITRNSEINFKYNNMGHMGESLLPCWSLLYELGAVRNYNGIGSDNRASNCGIDTSSFGPLKGWAKSLVLEGMKCKTRDGQTDEPTNNNTVGSSDQMHHPNLYLMSPYFRYMQYISHPSHAHLLRRNLVSDEFISYRKSYQGSERPFQIGLIERTKKRVILNLHDIAKGLSTAIPNANVTVISFDEGPTLPKQAEWWATKDVIIAAHGAGVMNSVFITPKTIVLQLYPRE